MTDSHYDSEPVAYISRHLVALTGKYKSTSKSSSETHDGIFVFSGFVISIDGTWFWTTAGHCLRDELDSHILDGILTISETGFADYFGTGATHFHILPYTYDPENAIAVFDKTNGLDFALIPLNGLIRAALERVLKIRLGG